MSTTNAVVFRSAFDMTMAAGGELEGICVPYGQVSQYTEHGKTGERFVAGAFARSVRSRAGKIRLKSLHGQPMPVAVDTRLEEQDGGLFAAFRFYDTVEGRAARERAKAGVYGGLSVEFRPVVQERASDGVMEVKEAVLHAVALEIDPAYEGAKILALRARSDQEREETAWLWENAPTGPAVDMPDLTRFLLPAS